MFPGEEYKFKGKKVTEYPIAQNGRATSADSLEVYNNSMAIRNYYENLEKKGWYKQPEVIDLSSSSLQNKDSFKRKMDEVKQKSLQTYRDILKRDEESLRNTPQFDYFKNVYPNTSYADYRGVVAKSLASTKSGSGDKYYYKDLYPSVIDPMAPSTLVNLKILPNEQLNFRMRGKDNKPNQTPPGGSITGLYTYNPLSVKPYSLRTKKEKIEWEKKYGKGTPPAKPTPDPKLEPTLKKKPVKMEPIKSKSFTSTPTIKLPSYTSVGKQDVPNRGEYRVSYYDPQIKDWNENAFQTEKESNTFASEMSGRGYGGSYGNVTQTKKVNKKKTGGWLEKYN
jgi:hypothetical protein